jgi:CheY-like chemotaxis protein
MTTESRALTAADLKRLKVLIIDPNAFMRGVLADSLRRLQVTQINASANAAEATVLGRTLKPDLIFVDWDAGRTSGLQFTRDLRRGETGLPRETPIVLLSNSIDHEQLMAARQAGINEFLLKPVSAQGVLSRVEEIVLRPRRFILSRTYIGPCRRRKDDPDFAGPWRRLTDEPPVRKGAAASGENLARLRAIVEHLMKHVDADADDPRSVVRSTYRLLNDYATEVRTVGDDVISRVWQAALRYIEGVGMTDNYDAAVIRYHFQTITRIIDMPEEAFIHRAAVANELDRLVAKKIQPVHDLLDNPSFRTAI